MKVYTDIEQGKELSFILPIDTADMHYQYVLPWSSTLHSVPSIGNPSEAIKWYNMGYEKTGQPPMELRDFCVPCWSLAALLNILPHCIDDGYDLTLGKLPDNESWYVCYDDVDHFVYIYVTKSNLVDACVEMILKLKENNWL